MRYFCQLLCCCLMCLLSAAAYSQDSVALKLFKAKDDTTKVKQLLLHGRKVRENSYAEAEKIFREAYETSKRIHADAAAGKSLLNLAGVIAYQGNYPTAIQQVHMAYRHFTKAGNTSSLATCHSSLGGMWGALGNTDSAIYHFDKALVMLGNKKAGIQSMQLYINLGVLHNSLRNYTKSIEYYEKALKVAQNLQDTSMITNALGSLSLAYTNLEDYEKAYVYAAQALKIAKQKKDIKGLSVAFHRYASVCNRLNKLEEAAASGREGLAYTQKLNDAQQYLVTSKTLADTYELQGKLDEAFNVLEVAKAEGEKHNLRMYLKDIYHALAELNLKRGQYKKAYEDLQKHKHIWDSTVTEKNKAAVAELDIKYQTAQKEKELSEKQVQLLQQDLLLEQTKRWVIYAVVATLIALLAAGFFYMNLLHKRHLHTRQLQTLEQEKEIELLQALMQGEEKERSRIARDLHDGVAGMMAAAKMHFSSITKTVNIISAEEGYQQGVKLLDEAIREVRLTSHNLMPEVLMQHGLSEALYRYCNSVNNKDLHLQFYALGTIGRFSGSFELSVYRIVQELVNNMIKHSKASEGLVQIAQQENVLSITIEDNGIGFNQDLNQEGTGLHSLHTRVKAMKGILEIEGSAKKGVSAYLEFEVSALRKQEKEVVVP